jgi:tetratricopeptide (TPR) repeat protein
MIMVNEEKSGKSKSDTPKIGMPPGMRKKLNIFLILLAVIFVIYLSSITTAFVFEDIADIDTTSLSSYSVVEILKGMKNPIRVLTNLSFAINYYFAGGNTASYYVINVLLHVINSFLVFLLTFKIMTLNIFRGSNINVKGSSRFYNTSIRDDNIGMYGHEENARNTAFMAAVLFAVHPISIYAVSYIAQRATLLCSAFYLSSMISFINSKTAANEDIERKNFRACIFLGILALLCRETAVTIIPVLFAFEVIFFDVKRNELLKKAVFYLSLILLLEILFLILPSSFFKTACYDNSFNIYERLLTQSRVLLFYVSMILFPTPDRLSLEYDIARSTSMIEPVSTVLSLAVISAVIVTAYIRRKKNPFFSFLTVWYFITLLVESILPLETAYLHRVYLASYAIFFAFGYFAMFLYEKVRSRKTATVLLIILFSFIIILLSAVTVKELGAFRSSVSLYEDAYKASPKKEKVLYNLAKAYFDAEKFKKAEEFYSKVIELNKNNIAAYFELANTYFKMERYSRAEEYYKKTKLLDMNFTGAYSKLGDLYVKVRQYELAIKEFEAVVSLDTGNYTAYNALADIYFSFGDFKKSIKYYLKAIELSPEDPYLHYRAAKVYELLKDYERALKEYETVLDIDIYFEFKEEVSLKIEEIIRKY